MKDAPFKIGDKVKSKYHPDETNVIRTVTEVIKDTTYRSGYAVSTDGGGACSECGRVGKRIHRADCQWFILVYRGEE